MSYTVHEIAQLSGVTIKTLYHYHKIGLLEPQKVTEAGYRIYGDEELKRLQQILLYRELEFPLADIKKLVLGEPDRLQCLRSQYSLLKERQQRMDTILKTLEITMGYEEKGEPMDKSKMFQGLNKEQWKEALSEQNEHLKKEYGYDLLESGDFQQEEMNEQAKEAISFMAFMAEALKNSRRPDDPEVSGEIERHIAFTNAHSIPTNARSFAAQTKFFLSDDFHRNMLEGQQTGLSYYLFAAAEMYAASRQA